MGKACEAGPLSARGVGVRRTRLRGSLWLEQGRQRNLEQCLISIFMIMPTLMNMLITSQKVGGVA